MSDPEADGQSGPADQAARLDELLGQAGEADQRLAAENAGREASVIKDRNRGSEGSHPPVKHFVASKICATCCEKPQVFDPTWATRIEWAEFLRAPSLKGRSY